MNSAFMSVLAGFLFKIKMKILNFLNQLILKKDELLVDYHLNANQIGKKFHSYSETLIQNYKFSCRKQDKYLVYLCTDIEGHL